MTEGKPILLGGSVCFDNGEHLCRDMLRECGLGGDDFGEV